MSVTIRIELDRIDEVIKKLHDAVKDIVSETADHALPHAQDLAPVDTSFMQKLAYVVTSERDGYGAALAAAEAVNAKGDRHALDAEPAPDNDQTAYIVFAAEHAIFVHDGTSRMGARPFLAQAVADEGPAWEARWNDLERRLR